MYIYIYVCLYEYVRLCVIKLCNGKVGLMLIKYYHI